MNVPHFCISYNELAVIIEIIQDLSFCHPTFKFVKGNLDVTGSAIFKNKFRQQSWVGNVPMLFSNEADLFKYSPKREKSKFVLD